MNPHFEGSPTADDSLKISSDINNIKYRAKTFFHLNHLGIHQRFQVAHLVYQLLRFKLFLTDVVIDPLLHSFLRFSEPCQSVRVYFHHSLEIVLVKECFSVRHLVKDLVEVVHADWS
jgi:hypothetical protein